MKRIRGPVFAGVLLLSLFTWGACGDDDDGGGASGDEATASVTLSGENFEFRNGACTLIEVEGGIAISLTLEMFTLGIGIIARVQSPADSGEPITDAVFNFIADGTPYASNGTADEITVTVDSDLGGGEFAGAIAAAATPGQDPVELTGTFTCRK